MAVIYGSKPLFRFPEAATPKLRNEYHITYARAMSESLCAINRSHKKENDTNNVAETPYRVLALYKFVKPNISQDALPGLQSEIETACRQHSVKGTLLLAEEGINGTICYPFDDSNIDKLLPFLQSKFDNSLRIRISTANRPVFTRLKVKIKREIVTMCREGDHDVGAVSPPTSYVATCNPTVQVGEYVKPQHWNELILDADTLVIDTRNEYEIDIGTFRNAINPHTQSFVEFPDWMKDNLVANRYPHKKKIAMFCTGGIRCEKATSACLQLLPKDVPVYHLEGGILAYLNDVPKDQSLFEGDCYVFDQRIAVTHGLQPSIKYQQSCHGCRHPLSEEDLKRDDFVEGVSCRNCTDQLTEKKQERYTARQRQIELAISGKPTCHDVFLLHR
jgi:UPF0176 protein